MWRTKFKSQLSNLECCRCQCDRSDFEIWAGAGELAGFFWTAEGATAHEKTRCWLGQQRAYLKSGDKLSHGCVHFGYPALLLV
ncbi:MAG TPA: hypothetical protein DDW52_20015 [Planctomycetaceae bacterium]|nr:hypothetical protein [Planctomycetaceae bacterium]